MVIRAPTTGCWFIQQTAPIASSSTAAMAPPCTESGGPSAEWSEPHAGMQVIAAGGTEVGDPRAIACRRAGDVGMGRWTGRKRRDRLPARAAARKSGGSADIASSLNRHHARDLIRVACGRRRQSEPSRADDRPRSRRHWWPAAPVDRAARAADRGATASGRQTDRRDR